MGGVAKAFTSIFQQPEKPDTSALEAQEAEARRREQEDRRKAKATLAAARQGSRFRLFAESGERGLRQELGG